MIQYDLYKYIATHHDKLVENMTILTGAMIGAFWKVDQIQVAHDLWTLQNIEKIVMYVIQAFVGAFVAWAFKTTCNRIRKNGRNKNAKSKQ